MTETVTTERLATVHWSEALSLDLDFMDDTHREFIDLLAAIETAEDEQVVDRFAAMVDHRWALRRRRPLDARHPFFIQQLSRSEEHTSELQSH